MMAMTSSVEKVDVQKRQLNKQHQNFSQFVSWQEVRGFIISLTNCKLEVLHVLKRYTK